MPFHKAVHAIAAVSDVLFDALFESQNHCGCLQPIHRKYPLQHHTIQRYGFGSRKSPFVQKIGRIQAATVYAPDIFTDEVGRVGYRYGLSLHPLELARMIQ